MSLTINKKNINVKLTMEIFSVTDFNFNFFLE